MQAQIKFGRIAGISIGLHYSWFIIAALITVSLAGHFHSVTPQWSNPVVWSAAIITGLLFFAALLAHEMAHSLVAKAYGLKVRAIALFALDGVSQIESEASDANSEFWVVAWPVPGTPGTMPPSGRLEDSPSLSPRKSRPLASRCARLNPAECGRIGGRARTQAHLICSRNMKRRWAQ